MKIKLTYDEINELMQLVEEYYALVFDDEKREEIMKRLREYGEKIGMPIMIYKNLGEYPSLVIDEGIMWINVSRNISVIIDMDGISVDVKEDP